MLRLQAKEPSTEGEECALLLEEADGSIRLRSTSYQAHNSSESKDWRDIKKNSDWMSKAVVIWIT